MNRVTINIIVGICFTIIGFVIGRFCLLSISFNPEIGLIEVVNIVVTVTLGIYIAHVLEKQVQDRRAEKDILIERISQIEVLINELEKIEAEKDIKYSVVINRVSKVREKKNRIIKHLKSRLSNSQYKQLEVIDQQLKPLLTTLKNLLTSTPINPSALPDIVMKNGKLRYSDNRVEEITATILDINDKLLELKLYLNIL